MSQVFTAEGFDAERPLGFSVSVGGEINSSFKAKLR